MFKAVRWLNHLTLGLRVIKKRRRRERGLMGWGFGLGVLGLVFGDWGSWFKVQGSGFRLRVWGLGLVTFSSFACSSTICF